MEEYEAMFYGILKKLNVYHKRDDYIDLCWIGYAKAVNNFDESKGTALRTYIYKCAKNEVLKEVRRENAQKRPQDNIVLDESIYTNKAYKVQHEPLKCQLESDLIVDESKTELYNAINSLKCRDKDIFTNLWKLRTVNLTRKQLAEKYAISETQVSNINRKAFKKIKELMKDE